VAASSARARQTAWWNHEDDAHARDAVPAYELGRTEEIEGARATDLTHGFVDLIGQAIDLSPDVCLAFLREQRRAAAGKQTERDGCAEAERVHGSLLLDAWST
jgi:hypothetical protein